MVLTPEQQASLSKITAVPGLLASILGMSAEGQSPAGRAISGVGAVGDASKLSGSLGGPALPGSVGEPLAGLGSAAGLGMGAYNIATNPSPQGKALGAVQTGLALPAAANATGVGAAAIGGVAPAAGLASGYLTAAILTDMLINKTGAARGGSALNKYTAGVDALVKPQGVAKFFDSPGKINSGQFLTGFTEDALGASPFMAALGLGPYHKPTTGTSFRRELGNTLGRAGIKDFDPHAAHDMDLEKYNSFSPGTRAKAEAIGKMVAEATPSGKKDPAAYAGQAARMLLSQYGDGVGELATHVGM